MSEPKLVVLGPKGTNGHEGGKKLQNQGWFPNWESPEIKFVSTNVDILTKIANNRSGSYGLVPIENGSGGWVPEVVHCWISMEKEINGRKNPLAPRLRVIGEMSIPVEHYLLVHPSVKNIREISEVRSHPQAIIQSRKNLLKKDLLGKTVACNSTAAAAFMASRDRTIAALASSFAEDLYELKRICRMHDFSGNATRFHIVAKTEKAQYAHLSEKGRTAVIFWLKNRFGALNRVTELFAKSKINMSVIHSIPLGRLNSYAFYCEFDEYTEPGCDLTIELQACCKKLLVLGSYSQEVK